MFVRAKKKANGKYSVQIVQSVRYESKVPQRVIHHLGQAAVGEGLDELTQLAEKLCRELEMLSREFPGA